MNSYNVCVICGDSFDVAEKGVEDVCGASTCESQQKELDLVLKFITEKRKDSDFYNDGEGAVYDALGAIIDELTTGEHR